MSAWPTVKLGQVTEFINGDRGRNYPSEGDFADQGIPFINAGHLRNGEVDFSEMNYINESRFNLLGSGKTKQHDILYCLRGSLGKTAIVRQKVDAAIASSLVIIRPSKDCSVGYLYHFLTSPLGNVEVRKFDNGSSQPNLSANSVKSYVLPLPPLAEQRRIAEVLDRAEALRANRRAALAQLDTLTQSLFLDLFGDPVSNAHEWPVLELQDVVREGTIVTYGIVQAGDEFPAGVPYIRTGDIVNGDIVTAGLRRTNPAIAAKFARSRVEVGEIVMSIRATVGTTALVPAEIDGANLTQGTARISPGKNIDRIYLLNLLRAGGTQHWISLQIKGATFREITLTRLRELPVMVPPLPLQREFARRVTAVEKLKTAHRASLSYSTAMKTAKAAGGEISRGQCLDHADGGESPGPGSRISRPARGARSRGRGG